jgi:hypothetical protein
MHDWDEVVRRHLHDLGLDRRDREEIVSELADHLEDAYEQARASGMSEVAAFRQCEEQLDQEEDVARSIERSKLKEGAMNYRTKTLWLPGLITLTVSSVLLMISQLVSQSARPFLIEPKLRFDNSLAFYIAWLITLPFCGAAGAYFSRRVGGKPPITLAAAVFPAIVMLAVLCLILPIGIFLERNTFLIHHLSYFGIAVVIWTIVPGTALSIGAVPFLAKKTQTS